MNPYAQSPKGNRAAKARYKRAADGDDDNDARSQEDSASVDQASATTQDDVADVRKILKKSDGGNKGEVVQQDCTARWQALLPPNMRPGFDSQRP